MGLELQGAARALRRAPFTIRNISEAKSPSGGRARRRVTGAPGRAGGGDRLVHDPPDGTDAPPTLCAATKAAVDLAGARRIRRRHRCAHVTVTEHVAGADDHEKARHQPVGTMCNYLLNWGRRSKRKAHNLHVFQSGLPEPGDGTVPGANLRDVT